MKLLSWTVLKTSYSDIWKYIPNYDWCKIGVNIPMLEGEKSLQTAPIGDLKEMEIDIYEIRNRRFTKRR